MQWFYKLITLLQSTDNNPGLLPLADASQQRQAAHLYEQCSMHQNWPAMQLWTDLNHSEVLLSRH